MDGDSDGVPGSDMRTNSYSEYGGGGKYTSSDPISGTAQSEAERRSDELRSMRNDSPLSLKEKMRREARANRIAPVKNTLIGFGVHAVIFILGLYLKLYNDLNTMHLFQTVEEVKTELGFFIILPFSAANPTLGNIFGSLYLILPLFIYYFASGKKGLIVFPIVLALILLGFYLGFAISGPILM